VGWLPRLVAALGALTLLYSLTKPWVTIRLPELRIDYTPWRVFEGMAQGRWGALEEMARVVSESPGGELVAALLLLHLALLAVALIVGALSLITGSAGSFSATAALSLLSAIALVCAAARTPFPYAVRSGAFALLASALIYLLAAALARRLG